MERSLIEGFILPIRRACALLSVCHLLHDALEDRRRRAVTVRARRAIGDLSTEQHE